jgi:predicted short-subunit dehydrogenase-like oxidoreductase (DUF2520 family)
MKTLTIIGCGKVGTTLAILWRRAGVFEIGQILNQSLASSRKAAGRIGRGEAVESFAGLKEADLFMISAADGRIAECCRRLCETGVNLQGKIVFHCSGSLPSAILEPARREGAAVASVHPVKSFADIDSAVRSFAGTFCAVEGDTIAKETLSDALAGIGAKIFAIDPGAKAIYHAAAVFASNYLVAVIEAGLRCYEQAGVPRKDALAILEPIVGGTVANLFRLGPEQALTGPIARGEAGVVRGHLEALTDWDPELAVLYRNLGRVALDLAAARGDAAKDALAGIGKLLEPGTNVKSPDREADWDFKP